MRLNPVPLMSLILLVIITLLLAFLTVVKSNQVRTYLEGDPADGGFKSNAKMRDEITQLEARMKVANDSIQTHTRVIDELDRQLAVARIHLDGSRAVAGVTLPPNDDLKDNPAAVLAGQKDTTWKFTSDLIAASVKRSETLKTRSESAGFQDNPALDEAIRKRQQELQDITKRISDDDEAFARDRDDLTKRLDDIALGKDKAEKQHNEDYSRLSTKESGIVDDIRKLLELKLKWMSEIEADGQVMEVATNQVVINLGTRDKVFPGLLFAVFNQEKGRYLAKGMLETIEVRDGIAICRVLSQEDPRFYPIGKGDSIGNPVFATHAPKTFFVAPGDFKHYNKEDIEQFIRATGGIVQGTLGPDCDFLVVGERSNVEASARQFQALAMSEDTLLSFVQKTFPPKR